MHSWWNSLSTHTPFLHGFLAHKSILSWHLFPVKPGGQLQLKSATKSVQFAPNRQGFSAQSSVLTSHNCPSQPGKHSQVNLPCCRATHVAPLLHGFPFAEHGSICGKKQRLLVVRNQRKTSFVTYRNIAVNSGISSSTKASVIVISRFIFAHGACRTSLVPAVRLFFLTVNSGISWGTLASVSLRQVYASCAVITRLRWTFVDVNFTAASRETSGAEALNSMTWCKIRNI